MNNNCAEQDQHLLNNKSWNKYLQSSMLSEVDGILAVCTEKYVDMNDNFFLTWGCISNLLFWAKGQEECEDNLVVL